MNIQKTFTLSSALRCVLLPLVLTFSAMAHSSQVIPLPLESVFSLVNVIAVGTVRHHKVTYSNRCVSRPNAPDDHYTIEISEVLVGKLQTKSLAIKFSEVCGSPEYSEYSHASDIERVLQIGGRYIFLFYYSDAEQKNPGEILLRRAETEDKRDAVLKAWRNHQEQEVKNEGK